ncbi:DUF5320 domain-containing protein [Marinisporobacter balticus]|uniref:Uncharacterized protein n=1 Tax=Marinisporobacter balticus TaxID=2018667 RepID=A0A4R2KKK7_9FIRM|nr:DUF5320 domain-containing protein [Marinisporobacter balticus]TCO74541.1 hypothetical protein EV214_11217 [Marinisporobacter balticus]
MPRLDGRGPNGMGSGTGRKRGHCNVVDGSVYGYGRGLGICRWMENSTLSEEELLEKQKTILENQLHAVKDKLNNNKNTGNRK